MNGWIQVAHIDDIPRQGARVVHTPYGDVAIFRTLDDQIHALHDRCPHKGGPLSQGIVHAQSVTCPLHSWVVNLASGEAEAPDVGCVRLFQVRTDNGCIQLQLAQEASQP